ncbi:MAG: DUF503 domain-containing protein [Gammaproteobacteria bacterium]|nr:DUF503 domain-containing protein [Gammaproteobacteria bacterium]
MTQSFQINVVLVTVEIIMPEASSLKDKRRITKSMKDRLRSKFNASIAEIGYLDKWQRTALGISLVGNNKPKLQRDVFAIETLLTGYTNVSISYFVTEWL